MIAYIDHLLNRITMYRLLLYYLMALIAAGLIFGALHLLPIDPLALLGSFAIILAVCWIANALFAKAFNVPANVESIYITAFILTLIISPISLQPLDMAGLGFLVWASIFAMASKYILAVRKKHFFNPAAIAVVITALALNQYASWWVGGNVPMLPLVLIGGLLVVRKIQRFDLVISFVIAALVSILITSASFDPLTTIEKTVVHTTLLFFAFVMLTEPMTTPPTRARRIIYGAFVGFLFSPAIHVGIFSSTPELALVAGNVLSYFMSPKTKYRFALKAKRKMGPDMYHFAFTTDKKVIFKPGQYMEWTVSPEKSDTRGNRRYFTIASSPTEPDVYLGVKFTSLNEDAKNSTFKEKLRSLEPGATIMGGQLAGDFTLPRDSSQKLVFMAGGIGITPFRSMVKYLHDTQEQRDITLLYSNRSPQEITYKEIFDAAQKTIGLKTVYINTETEGRLDAARLLREVPDARERLFYISGPRAMVVAFENTLSEIGISRTRIHTDFFPGFV
jgi:ferredoxin-NADP reductase